VTGLQLQAHELRIVPVLVPVAALHPQVQHLAQGLNVGGR
jgi:hypothetical protein